MKPRITVKAYDGYTFVAIHHETTNWRRWLPEHEHNEQGWADAVAWSKAPIANPCHPVR